MLKRIFLLLSFLSLIIWVASAAALPVPKLSSPVVDLAGALSSENRAKISASLRQFQSNYGPQLQVLIVPSLQNETIESFSIKVVDKWKLGRKGKDDGVLLLVATQDRRVRIEVGRGLEGDLPDALAGRIINENIVPFFKQGNIAAGVLSGLQRIAENVGGSLENVPKMTRKKAQRGDTSWGFILFIIFFLIGPSLFGRRRRGGSTSALLSGLLIGGMMSGGRGGGGFGGGGFSGGGGGGFSGGGASGSW